MSAVAGKRSVIPWLFVGGLGLVFVVNMGLLWAALSTHPGTIARNSYEAGRTYNRVLAHDARQAAMGWTVAVAATGAGPVELRVSYAGPDGQPLDGLTVQATLTRPLGDRATTELRLAPAGPGVYAAAAPLPHRGAWDVSLRAEQGGGRSHDATRRIHLP